MTDQEPKKKNSVVKIQEKQEVFNMARTKKYTASDIEVLEGLEAVRKRPGMYIGSTGIEGLHHLISEVVDNSIDEHMAGYCQNITVKLEENNYVSIIDDGRGIPVDHHSKKGKSSLDVVMTTLHAGAKFDSNAYTVSGGLHGVGISVVNALSHDLEVQVRRDGKIFTQHFSRGISKGKMSSQKGNDSTGTFVRFAPDPEIFGNNNFFDYNTIANRLQELTYLNAGLKITLEDVRGKNPRIEEFCYEEGLLCFMNTLLEGQEAVFSEPISFIAEKDGKSLEVCFQYINDDTETVYSYANNIRTAEGGTHEAGFKSAVAKATNSAFQLMNLFKKKDNNFQAADTREGLIAIVSVKLTNPMFEGQTKTRLGNTEIKKFVEDISFENITKYLHHSPNATKFLFERIQRAEKSREAAKRAREAVRRQSVMDSFGLPGKLSDCSIKDPSQSELFIVEGDSAGGSAKQGRNRLFQAILPLRGKILNVERADFAKVYSNEEIKTLITAIGAGVGKKFDSDKMRYHKIFIMTDADVDGSHIRVLLLTFFFRYMKKIIELDRLHIARPPLYRVMNGKSHEYFYDDSSLKAHISTRKNKEAVSIQRYKGLGEMTPEQLWLTTLDPEKRASSVVKIDDAEQADQTLQMLMGNEVESRRRFISENATLGTVDI